LRKELLNDSELFLTKGKELLKVLVKINYFFF
jgi:hypothetical protein